MGKIGLMMGSFNPIHHGHFKVATYMRFCGLDEIWFVVSPQNPLKDGDGLLDGQERLNMVRMAICDHKKFRVSDVEFRMPRPSYTIDTLDKLKDENPKVDFIVIAGSDIFTNFTKWKDHEKILSNYKLFIYPRPGYELNGYKDHPSVTVFNNAPGMDISSSIIRDGLKDGRNMAKWLHPRVNKQLLDMHFYR